MASLNACFMIMYDTTMQRFCGYNNPPILLLYPWRNRNKPGILLKLPQIKQHCLISQYVSPCSDLQCQSYISMQRFINRQHEHRLCPWDEICCSPGRADRHYLCLTSLACDVAMLACLNSIKPLLFALQARGCLRKLVPGSVWDPLSGQRNTEER